MSKHNAIGRVIIQPKMTKSGVTNKAIWKVLSTTIVIARLRSPFIAALTAVAYLLALLTIGTIIRLIKPLLILDASTNPKLRSPIVTLVGIPVPAIVLHYLSKNEQGPEDDL
jgi:hypothetical protein